MTHGVFLKRIPITIKIYLFGGKWSAESQTWWSHPLVWCELQVTPFTNVYWPLTPGPWGKALFERVRPDLADKFDFHFGKGKLCSLFPSLLLFCNQIVGSQTMSTTATLRLEAVNMPSRSLSIFSIIFSHQSLTVPIGWAQKPLIGRFRELPTDLELFFIYGKVRAVIYGRFLHTGHLDGLRYRSFYEERITTKDWNGVDTSCTSLNCSSLVRLFSPH